jgi:hypothetical protein
MKKKLLALLLALVLCTSSFTACGSSDTSDVTEQEQIEDVVYITDTGSKYHAEGCRYLSQSCKEIDRQKAEDEGYEPCSVCNP